MISETIRVSTHSFGRSFMRGRRVIIVFPRTRVELVLANVVIFVDDCHLRSDSSVEARSVMKLAWDPLSSKARNEYLRPSMATTSSMTVDNRTICFGTPFTIIEIAVDVEVSEGVMTDKVCWAGDFEDDSKCNSE